MKTIPRLLALTVLLATAQYSPAAAPTAINYQGRLTNATGVPQPGIKAMSLKIYDAATDGILLYTETIGNVTIDANGVYGFQFGANGAGTPASLINAIAASAEQWLELIVDGVAQAPRQKILAVPYALMAGGLPDGAVSSAMIADGSIGLSKITGLGTAAVADIQLASSTAINSYISRERFAGATAAYSANATLASEESGTVITYDNGTSGVGALVKSGGALTIKTDATRCGIKAGTTIKHTAGFTGIAYLRIDNAATDSIRVGFTTSSFFVTGFANVHSGVDVHSNVIRGIYYGGAYPIALSGSLLDNVKNGDLIGIAMRLTSDGYEVWMQGGPCTAFGADVGTSSWMMLQKATTGVIPGDLAFGVQAAAGTCVIHEFSTTSSFTPDERRAKNLGCNTNKFISHTSACEYDSSGNLWTTWWEGAVADAANDGTSYVRVRTAGGAWSEKTVIQTGVWGDPGSFLMLPNGTVQVIYNKSTDNEVTYALKRRTLAVSPSGVVTAGPETGFTGIVSTFILNYQRPITLTTGAHAGRILLPCNTLSKSLAVYSDDDGATWTEGGLIGGIDVTTNGAEAAIVEEGVSKTLAAYVRLHPQTSTYAPRWVSMDGGETWTVSGSIPVPSNDSRFNALRLPSGVVAVVGNDSYTSYVRKNTSIWLLGDSGAFVGKIPVHTGSGGGQNYPSIAARGDMVALVMPVRKNPAPSAAEQSPGQVFFGEQTMEAWAGNAAKSADSLLNPRNNTPYAGTPSLAGDVTSSAGVTTIGAGKVTNSMLAGSIATSKITGLGTAATADSAAFATVAQGMLADSALQAESIKGVIVTKASGVRTAYPPSADTDTARGMALEAAFAAAAAGDTIDLSPGNYYVAKSPTTIAGIVTQFAILNEMTIRLNGARLYKQITDTASCMFSMATTSVSLGANDWSIIGPGILEGCAVATGVDSAEIGVDVRSCRRWRIENVTMIKFRGTGLQLNSTNFTGDPLGYLPNKTATGHVAGCHFDLNNIGMSCHPGNEYTSFANCTFNANLTGADVYAGNTKFVGCEASGNTDYALRIRNGGNDGHGCWVGGWITHNAGFGVAAEVNMDNGFLFTGATIAGDGVTANKIQSLGGGLTFTGCFLDSPFYASATPTGVNTVQGCFIAGTFAVITDFSSAERAKWKFHGNHTLTGSWANNDPPSSNLASHADNAAALAGGLIAGDMYMVTGSNPRQVAIVY